MKLLITIAALVLLGCGPPRLLNIFIHIPAHEGNIEAVKQHIAAGTDVNKKDRRTESTPLDSAARNGPKDIVELLIANGTDVNAMGEDGSLLDGAIEFGEQESADLLRKHGGKTD